MNNVNINPNTLQADATSLILAIHSSLSPRKQSKATLNRMLLLCLLDPKDWFSQEDKDDMLYLYHEIVDIMDQAHGLNHRIRLADKLVTEKATQHS